jgi:rhodanese-related sulfurtransferase
MSIFGSVFGMSAQQSDQITVLEVTDFKKEITKTNVQLLDVRTANEYNAGHIKNAINVDVLNQNAFTNYVKDLDLDQPVYLYCRSGGRSQTASKLLVELGFKEIYDLKGGYLNWSKN